MQNLENAGPTKNIFGYSKFSSVTAMLVGLPSFNTVLHNAAAIALIADSVVLQTDLLYVCKCSFYSIIPA